jgi:hypothetical protein
MKNLLFYLILFANLSTFAQWPKVKLGGGTIPPDTTIQGTKFVIKDHWSSFGPWAQIPPSNVEPQNNTGGKKLRTSPPVMGVNNETYSTKEFVPLDAGIAISNQEPGGGVDQANSFSS